MIKSIKKCLLGFAAGLITMAAMSGTSAACAWGFHEPEIPESLRKEL